MIFQRYPTILKVFKYYIFPCLCTISLAIVFLCYYAYQYDPNHIFLKRNWNGSVHLNFTYRLSSTINLSSYFQSHFSYPPGINLLPIETVAECNCERPLIYFYQGQSQESSQNRTPTIVNSTCSDPGTWLSPLQKVISFSLYIFPNADLNSSLNFYLEGLHINLEALRQNYPGYTLRLYTDIPRKPFCPFYCVNPDLFWCNINRTPLYGDESQMYFTTWRFLPLGDPSVDIFLSRDLDSVVTKRESAVVQDWLKFRERKAIHLMRDKHWAHNTPILGGLWGARNGYFGEVNGTGGGANKLIGRIRRASRVNSFEDKRDTGFDQQMLMRVVFKGGRNRIVAYDSYHCKAWKEWTMVRPFPVRRKDNKRDFVGNVGFGKAEYELKKCPVECRPKWGRDWEYC